MTRTGRRFHFCFTLAAVLATFDLAPQRWAWHILLAVAVLTLLVAGILGAMGAALIDIWRGRP